MTSRGVPTTRGQPASGDVATFDITTDVARLSVHQDDVADMALSVASMASALPRLHAAGTVDIEEFDEADIEADKRSRDEGPDSREMKMPRRGARGSPRDDDSDGDDDADDPYDDRFDGGGAAAPNPGFDPAAQMRGLSPREQQRARDLARDGARDRAQEQDERLAREMQAGYDAEASQQPRGFSSGDGAGGSSDPMRVEGNDALPDSAFDAPDVRYATAQRMAEDDAIAYSLGRKETLSFKQPIASVWRPDPVDEQVRIAQEQRRSNMYQWGAPRELVRYEESPLLKVKEQVEQVKLSDEYNDGVREFEISGFDFGDEAWDKTFGLSSTDQLDREEFEDVVLAYTYGGRLQWLSAQTDTRSGERLTEQPMDADKRKLPDGREVENPFSWWTMTHEVRFVDDGGNTTRRTFRYRRKTDEEWRGEADIRVALLQQRWDERMSRVFDAEKEEVLRTVRIQMQKLLVDETYDVVNPFKQLYINSKGKATARGEREWFIPWDGGGPKPIQPEDDGGMVGPMNAPIPRNEFVDRYGRAPIEGTELYERWAERQRFIEDYIEQYRTLWHEEYLDWVKEETLRSEKMGYRAGMEGWKLVFSDEKRRLGANQDKIRAVEAVVYPWEDTDVATGKAIELKLKLPKGTGRDTMIYASHERAVVAESLKVKAIQKLHMYMTQTGAPCKDERHFYYNGAFWRANVITRMLDRCAEATANGGLLSGSEQPGVPYHLCIYGVGAGGRYLDANGRHVDECRRLAQVFDVLMPVQPNDSKRVAPLIDTALSFESIHGLLSADVSAPGWIFKSYPIFLKYWQDVRMVCFNAMLFSTGKGHLEPEWFLDPAGVAPGFGTGPISQIEPPREAQIYEAALRIITGKLDGVSDKDDLTGYMPQGFTLVDGVPTCLDIEMLRLQFEEFDRSDYAIHSDALAEQPNYSVLPAVPRAKHEVYLSMLVDQLASDPFAMPLWSRWLAPRFYKKGPGNKLMQNVWYELDGYRKNEGKEYWDEFLKVQKKDYKIANPATAADEMRLNTNIIAADVAGNFIASFLAEDASEPDVWRQFGWESRAAYVQDWHTEALQYVTAEPRDPKTLDPTKPGVEYEAGYNEYKTAISEMVKYLLRSAPRFLKAGQTEDDIHRTQHERWRWMYDGTEPLTLEDIIERRDQGFYTGETAIAIDNLKRDLTALFGFARARYCRNFTGPTSEADAKAINGGWIVPQPRSVRGESSNGFSERSANDVFDAQYSVDVLQDLGINGSKFFDFTRICERFYLKGYTAVSATKTQAQRKEAAEKAVVAAQKEVDEMEQRISKQEAAVKRQPSRKAKETVRLGDDGEALEDAKPSDLNEQLRILKDKLQDRNDELSLRNPKPLTEKEKHGATLGRLPTIRKMQFEFFTRTESVEEDDLDDIDFLAEARKVEYYNQRFLSSGDEEEYRGGESSGLDDIAYGEELVEKRLKERAAKLASDRAKEEALTGVKSEVPLEVPHRGENILLPSYDPFAWESSMREEEEIADGNPAIVDSLPSRPWEWRKRRVYYYLRTIVEGRVNPDGLTGSMGQQVVKMLNEEQSRWFPYDPETDGGSMPPPFANVMSTDDEKMVSAYVFNRMGVHQLADVFLEAQRRLGIKEADLVLPRGLTDTFSKFDATSADLVGYTTERIKAEGVPPVPGVPRDLQGGTVFLKRLANGFVAPDNIDPKDQPYKTGKEVRDYMLKVEREDPIREWCDRLTGRLKIGEPDFFRFFPPVPDYFRGGEAGEWWQRIVEKSTRQDMPLQEAAYTLVLDWDDSGIFAWRRSVERWLEPDDVQPVFVGSRKLPVETRRETFPGGPYQVLEDPFAPPSAPPDPDGGGPSAEAPAPSVAMDESDGDDSVADIFGDQPWSRSARSGQLFLAPYPMWHPEVVGYVSDQRAVLDLQEIPGHLGDDGKRRTAWDYWHAMQLWLTGPTAVRDPLFAQQIKDRTFPGTRYKLAAAAYKFERYYAYWVDEQDAGF